MEYILQKRFISQPLKVQKSFLDWWKPSIGDLFSGIQLKSISCGKLEMRSTVQLITNSMLETNVELNRWSKACAFYNSKTHYVIPLLTEGQLRKYIEDKIGCKIKIVYVPEDLVEGKKAYYRIERTVYLDGDIDNNVWIAETNNLFEAYWQVACRLSK